MKIVLKSDWDASIQQPVVKTEKVYGHFAGRKKELDAIKNELKRKKQGTILITGYRGVGKTSAIYKIVHELMNESKNIIPVLMNAAQLGDVDNFINSKAEIKPKLIIQNLIRRLYKTVKDRNYIDPTGKISTLYKKAVAASFQSVEKNSLEETDENKEAKREKISLFYKFDLKHLIFYFLWSLALLFWQIDIISIKSLEWINKLLSLLFFVCGPIVLNYEFEKISESFKSSKIDKTAEEIYKKDATIGNLEFDLEEIHRIFEKNHCKIIYIIDELDKIEPTDIPDILKYFKNLFTLSNALFIFIGSETILNEFKTSPPKAGEYRSEKYTYFNSQYFLARPLWQDLSGFIDEIVDKTQSKFTDKEFEDYKRYVIYCSKNDFFDLTKCIKDTIRKYESDGTCIIEISSFSTEDELKIKMCILINSLFEQKYIVYEPSRWEENEKLLKTLFTQANEILKNTHNKTYIENEGNDIYEDIINDFYNLLHRCGAFNVTNTTERQLSTGRKSYNVYSYIGNIPCTPPLVITELSEIEKEFIRIFEEHLKYVLETYNIYTQITMKKSTNFDEFIKNRDTILEKTREHGLDIVSVINSNFPIYEKLRLNKPPSAYKREDIEKRITQIKSNLATLKGSLFNNQIIKMIISLFPNLNLQSANLNQNGGFFGNSANDIRVALYDKPNVVIYKSDLSKQILVTHGQVDILSRIKTKIFENSANHRVIVLLNGDEDIKTRGLYKIDYSTPQKLKNSTIYVIERLDNFFKGSEEQE